MSHILENQSNLIMNRLTQYVKDTKGELKHVSWPTQKQTTVFTALVIVVSLFIATFLGAFDYVLTGLIDKYII